MALTIDQVLALPIRSFERSTKRVLFELVDGKQFYMVGGQDVRPRNKGVAYYTPREMIMVVNKALDEETFRGLIKMKEMGIAAELAEIIDPVTPPKA